MASLLPRLVTMALVVVAGLSAAPSVRAAEPPFLPGLSVGFEPPPSMTPAGQFSGYVDERAGASIIIVEMPAEAYADIEKGFNADALKGQGVTVRKRAPFALGKGLKAFLVEGTQKQGTTVFDKWILVATNGKTTALVTVQAPATTAGYDSATVEKSLKTIAFRAPPGVDEQLASLPFRVGDRAGFRIVRVATGNSVLMTQGPKDVVREAEQPLVIVSSGEAAIPGTLEQDRFAKQAFSTLPGIANLAIQRIEGKDENGVPMHEIVATADDVRTKQRLFLMQIVRFERSNYLRLVVMARENQRGDLEQRARTIAAGLSVGS